MLQLYKNIKHRRKELGMTQTDLAKKLGYTDKSMISKIENGSIDLPQSKIISFAEVLNISPSDLMGWEEPSPANKLDYSKISNIMPLPYKEGRTVPLIGSIACGTPILADENIEKEIQLPEDISADFCLRCKGDSMINAGIFDGDLLIVTPQKVANNGDIVVAVIGEEATVKTFYREKGRIRLQPENDAMEPIYVTEVELAGKVTGLFRSMH